jgi:hypothetical protein
MQNFIAYLYINNKQPKKENNSIYNSKQLKDLYTENYKT